MSLLSENCKYIGEGNAHVVLKLLHTNDVLRLNKQSEDLNQVHLAISFVNRVMSPLFNSILTKYEVIELSEYELTQLVHTLEGKRPEHRKIQYVFSKYAIKAPNLLIIAPDYDSYCIEIKPKEGFISARLKEYSKCYFCLKQFLKFKENQISTFSKYCPLDLFSGDKQRMKYAMCSLINNPQNNFKVFRNDNMIYGENSSIKVFNDILNNVSIFEGSKDLFLEFLAEILLNNNKQKQIVMKEAVPMSTEKNKTNCIETCHTSSDNLLHKLLFVQKLSENVICDIKSEGIEYVSSILNQLENASDEHLNDNIDQFLMKLNPVHKALISAVAKDCSIMISFSLNYIEGFPSVVIGDHVISYRLAVTDLEPKPAKTLVKRKRTEEKLIKLYKDHVQSLEKHDYISDSTSCRDKSKTVGSMAATDS